MGMSSVEHLDPETALQICQRTRSTVVVQGSIANLGAYVIGLKERSASQCGVRRAEQVAQFWKIRGRGKTSPFAFVPNFC
jgi:hypothetical protein